MGYRYTYSENPGEVYMVGDVVSSLVNMSKDVARVEVCVFLFGAGTQDNCLTSA